MAYLLYYPCIFLKSEPIHIILVCLIFLTKNRFNTADPIFSLALLEIIHKWKQFYTTLKFTFIGNAIWKMKTEHIEIVNTRIE